MIYVSPAGDDRNRGTDTSPVRSLYRAAELAREITKHRSVDIILAGGNHYLPEPLVLAAEDSGTDDYPVIWRADKNESVRLVGGVPLDLRWEVHKGPIFKASIPDGVRIESLFLNGERQVLARYPNYTLGDVVLNGAAPTGERMKQWAHPETAYIHGIADPNWGGAHAILKRDKKGALYEFLVSIDTTTPSNSGSISQHDRFVENVFEELDAPKEWFFDKEERTLYFHPLNPDDLEHGLFEAICNPHLVRIEGNSSRPVHHITFSRLTFTGAAPTWKQTQDHLPNGGDYVVHRGGAVLLSGTEDCVIEKCSFIELGGNAVFVNGYNRRTAVHDCLIHNVGANGIALCGSSDTMRGEQFFEVTDKTVTVDGVVRQKWEEPRGWYELPEDLEPGPKTTNYPSQCHIRGNLITIVGELEKQTAGILLSMTKDNCISCNSIHKVPRAGICLHDGAWSGNIIEHNDVFDTVRETADHGPFNSWGKDRYWGWKNHDGEHDNAKALHDFCLIDAVDPNHIRNNRFAHLDLESHSYGIDLDDGSTNFRIYNNLTLGCAIKLREGMHRVVENNILVGRGKNIMGRHNCMPDNQDVFRRNIVINAHGSVVIQNYMSTQVEMLESDYNLFFANEGPPVWKQGGDAYRFEEWQQKVLQESHSAVGDPLFVDAAGGDYRVRPGSPALELGFRNFPMQFGVTAPDLIALLPERRYVAVCQAAK